MFMDNMNENWDSTENQDMFIKEYFGKGKVLSKNSQNVLEQPCDIKQSYFNQNKHIHTNQDEKDKYEDAALFTSTQVKNQHPSNTTSDIKLNKNKRKKSESKDHCSEINANYTDIAVNESHTTDINNQRVKKRKRSKAKRKKVTFEQPDSSYEETLKQIRDTKKIPSESEDTSATSTFSGISLVKKSSGIQSKCFQKLQAAKFRYLNEMLYTNAGKEALLYFQQNIEEFQDYHLGYQSQVSKWPVNPVDIIIQEISQMNEQVVIADLGCGEAKIAEVFPKRAVHSFDLISLKDWVTACDISHVPLPNNSVDVAVFCLSLMGTNWKDYIIESHRILKLGAVLKIAEIESRIEDLELFIKNIEHYGFSLDNKNLSYKMFVFLNFKKINRKKKKCKVIGITLKPCLYKKR